MKILVVIDMQYDFTYGALRNEEAIKIIPAVKKKIDEFEGMIIYTRDTHFDNYLDTQEGRRLPVKHCIKGTRGHEIIAELYKEGSLIFDKNIFGSYDLIDYLKEESAKQAIEEIEFIGVCTDICVISNAVMAKSALPEVTIVVDESCSRGVSEKSHNIAIEAMKNLQIEVR